MFQLVQRIPNGLGELRNRLEAHIHNQGLNAIERCGESALNDPKIYVTTTLNVHKKYNALVVDAFNNDAGFVAALDKVFISLFIFSFYSLITILFYSIFLRPAESL